MGDAWGFLDRAGRREGFPALEEGAAPGGNEEGGELSAGGFEEAFCRDVFNYVPQTGLGITGGDAEDGELVVAPVHDLFGAGTEEDIDNMGCSKAFAGAGDGGEDFLGDFGSVEGFRGRKADVTGAAVFGGRFLAQVFQDEIAAAGAEVAELHHLVQAPTGAFLFLRVFHFVEEELVLDAVTVAVEQDTFAGEAVASGAATLLVVPFEALGEVVVDDQADVGFVDAHAEGDGCHDDVNVVADEPVLNGAAEVGVQTGRGRARR